MCGIVGFTGTKDPKKLDTMLSSIQHRGPDDEARFEDDNFQLGMRRLAIIDLTPDIYPMSNEKKDIFCVFNGEVYNYKEVREELKLKGHIFLTESDSEVIVHGYEEWDYEVFSHLRGMFAIALYDKRKEELILARDRIGIKPLYFSEVDGRIVFASEIKALFSAFDIDRSYDPYSVYKFLLTRVHDDTKHTFFKNVKRVMPGHFMTIDKDGNFRTEKYWLPKATTEFRSLKPDEYYAKNLREQFTESMRLHMISDVPLGVTLSGGLDSSAVACVASSLLKEGTSDTHTGGQLYTFSAIHPGENIDESEYIDEVVNFAGTNSIKIVPEIEKFWDEIETWLYFQEEPVISTAPYAYYTVMREAKKHVTVLLSGQGGDELFAGYIPYFQSYINSARDAGALLEIFRETIKGFDLYLPFFKQMVDKKLKKKESLDVREMINTSAADSINSEESLYHKHKRNLNERLFQDLTETTVPNLLRYEDKNGMANSLESRVPFLDHELVEFVFNLPIDQKIKNGWNRYVYRQAMKGLVPDKNRLRRNKVGFVNSEWEWLKARASKINEIFSSESFRDREFWDSDKVLSQFNMWVEGRIHGDGLVFWRILNVELWLRQWVDEFKRPTQV